MYFTSTFKPDISTRVVYDQMSVINRELGPKSNKPNYVNEQKRITLQANICGYERLLIL